MQLGFAIHIAKNTTGLYVGNPFMRINPHAAHERHVEHQGAVSDGQAGDVVAAALDAEQEVVFARKPHALDHIGDAETASDDRGPSVEHAVPDRSRVVVTHVTWREYRPTEPRLPTVDLILRQVDLPAIHRSRSHGGLPSCLAKLDATLPPMSIESHLLPEMYRPLADHGKARRMRGSPAVDAGVP